MELTTLPPCRWRSTADGPALVSCASPKLSADPGGIPAAVCLSCYCRDHAPLAPSPPPVTRSLPPEPAQIAPACSRRGAATGETAQCGTCRAGTRVKEFACTLHGRCTIDRQAPGVQMCAGCQDRRPPEVNHPLITLSGEFPHSETRTGRDDHTTVQAPVRRTFPVRHCLYHVWPLASGAAAWRRCCAMLAARAGLFTGRKIVAVATGPGAEGTAAVRAALPGWEVIEAENDPKLREAKTLPLLLGRLDMADPDAAVFFGHAKGVTRPWNAGVTCHPWAWLLHEALLDHWPAVEASLAAFPITGAMKKLGRGFVGSRSSWHYSGSFFWARADALVGRAVEQAWYGVESSPGLWFTAEQAGCVFHEGTLATLNLYDPRVLGRVLLEWQWWRAEHEVQRTVVHA